MHQEQTLISIITPAYNAADYITETIESVMRQSYQNWEMIIVDDCSTDNTRDIINRFALEDSRIRPVFLEVNSGAAAARNAALKMAGGRYVAFLDSDDLWKPEKLDKQLTFMKLNQYAFTFTAYEMISEDGTPLHKLVDAPRFINYEKMLKNTIVGCLTVMIDLERTGSFEMPDIRTRQDLAAWLSILRRGHTAFGLNEVLAEYRTGNSSISQNKWKAAKMNWFVYRKVEKLHLAKACWCFSNYAVHAVLKRF
ncbi:teichuronic acid biosynthesis protein TuaG [Peribacillus sp. SCS-37]|uniref:teichuronic acid biosynthesis protein TuaG n=1 Tax=Paraperibacillus esterisolvens TaxID=3115296 RepID=UPI003906ADEE